MSGKQRNSFLFRYLLFHHLHKQGASLLWRLGFIIIMIWWAWRAAKTGGECWIPFMMILLWWWWVLAVGGGTSRGRPRSSGGTGAEWWGSASRRAARRLSTGRESEQDKIKLQPGCSFRNDQCQCPGCVRAGRARCLAPPRARTATAPAASSASWSTTSSSSSGQKIFYTTKKIFGQRPAHLVQEVLGPRAQEVGRGAEVSVTGMNVSINVLLKPINLFPYSVH